VTGPAGTPRPPWELHHGEALATLAALPTGSCDALITDPPYSSGGQYRSDRTGGVHAKYVQTGSGSLALPGFAGDNRDQRAYGYWSALWLSEALRVVRPGGAGLIFTDWRQLPVTTDAYQAGGWVWRGMVPWVKPGARPRQGGFAAACEYVVWGSAGPLATGVPDCLPGVITAATPREREHLTQKPVDLLRALVRIVPPGGVVLDPFAGSGTTGVAALAEGRRFVGVEQVGEHVEVARRRLAAASDGWSDGASRDAERVGLW
jgi:site-specific DNA-methyltransferase (adenine-specific)